MGPARGAREGVGHQAHAAPDGRASSCLGYETLRVNDAPEQLVVGYHAEPGSASERALALLGAMAAEQAVPAVATTV